MTILNKVSCPICGSWTQKAVLQWNGVSFYECEDCTHIFTSNLIAFANTERAQELQELYGQEYLEGNRVHRVHYADSFDEYYIQSRQRLSELRKFVSPPGDLLEIGCNIGYFVKAAKEDEWTPVGLDISAAAIAIARQKTQNIDFRVGKLEDFDFPPNSFSVVCSFHTLEHIATPMSTLTRIHHVLTSGGFFYAEVPYTRRVIGKKGVTNYTILMEQEHLSHFSPRSLCCALVRSGFRIRKLRLVGGGYGLGILQPRTDLVDSPGIMSALSDQVRKALFALRYISQWNPTLRNAVRQFYWNTLRQGGGIEVFAEKI